MGFGWKDIAAMGLSGVPKQVFESDAFSGAASRIGKILPNEAGKYQDYTKNVPILNWLVSGMAATDNAATALSDTGSASKMWEAGSGATFGKVADPGQYGAGGLKEDWDSNDAFQAMIGNYVGGIGNFAGRIFGNEGFVSPLSKVTGGIDDMFQPDITSQEPQAENYDWPTNPTVTNNPDPYKTEQATMWELMQNNTNYGSVLGANY